MKCHVVLQDENSMKNFDLPWDTQNHPGISRSAAARLRLRDPR